MFEGKAPWVIGALGFALLLGVYFDIGGSDMKAPYPMNVIMPAVVVFCGSVVAGLVGSYIFKRGVNFDTRIRHGAVVAGVVCFLFSLAHFW